MPIEQTPSGAIVATGDGIAIFQLLALRGAVKLEQRGLKRRGPSAASCARRQLGLKPRASYDQILEAIAARLPPL